MKVTAWRTWAKDCLYQRHTQYHCQSISRLGYDPSVDQTAESYFTTKVNKNSKAVRDKTRRQSQIQWCKLMKSPTNMKNLISCLQTMERRMEYTLWGQKYPLKRDSKSTKQQSIIKIYCKIMHIHQTKYLHFQLVEDIIVLYKDET